MTTTALPTVQPLLARQSVANFAWVMGLGGLANAYAGAHAVFGLPLWCSQVLLGLSSALFALLVVTHVAKALLHFDAVRAEFNHAVRSSFFPAASVATVVVAIGLRPYNEPLARALWCLGAAAHFALALTLIRRWLLAAQDKSVMTPAWFIPVVGNILLPVGGAPLGFVHASWFFFSVGLVLWLVFFTIAMHRVLFFAPMSERSIPTLFILLAPPSIGFAAYTALEATQVGQVGLLATVLYNLALFIAILLATLVPRITHGPFFLSWWAMTFPLDGWAGACLAYHRLQPGPATGAVAAVALGCATLMVLWMTLRTLLYILQGKAFLED